MLTKAGPSTAEIVEGGADSPLLVGAARAQQPGAAAALPHVLRVGVGVKADGRDSVASPSCSQPCSITTVSAANARGRWVRPRWSADWMASANASPSRASRGSVGLVWATTAHSTGGYHGRWARCREARCRSHSSSVVIMTGVGVAVGAGAAVLYRVPPVESRSVSLGLVASSVGVSRTSSSARRARLGRQVICSRWAISLGVGAGPCCPVRPALLALGGFASGRGVGGGVGGGVVAGLGGWQRELRTVPGRQAVPGAAGADRSDGRAGCPRPMMLRRIRHATVISPGSKVTTTGRWSEAWRDSSVRSVWISWSTGTRSLVTRMPSIRRSP